MSAYDGSGNDTGPGWGWCSMLLPQMEENAIYGTINFSLPIEHPMNAARVASVLRRSGVARPAGARIEFPGLKLDLATREVMVGRRLVEMPSREFDLLAFLASSPRETFTREQLLEHVWGSSADAQNMTTVTEHIRRIRSRIEKQPERPRWIRTVRGVGYRFEG